MVQKKKNVLLIVFLSDFTDPLKFIEKTFEPRVLTCTVYYVH